MPEAVRPAGGLRDRGGLRRAQLRSDRQPQQIIDKVHRHHEQFGHTVLHLHADAGGLTDARHRASLELFQSDVAPVLRREFPDPPFAWGPVLPVTEESAHV